MKKVIRLTESDLTRIVKRVIKENNTKMELINTIKDEGFNSTAEMVGGVKNLIKLLGVKTPTEFLHLFDDLDVVQSEENNNWSLFRYKPKHNIMVYNKKNEVLFIFRNGKWDLPKGGIEKGEEMERGDGKRRR